MTGPSDRQGSLQKCRREVLRWISTGSIALAVSAATGCSGSIPPRKVKKIPSHISGMRGGSGRMPAMQPMRPRTAA